MAKKSAAAVADAPAHTVKVEDVGPCRKKLTFEIPADRVAGVLSEKFEGLSTSVALPGFRPGHAPRKLVERRFGEAVREEAKQQLAAEAYQEAVKEHSLRVLGDPEGGDEIKDADLSGGKALKFSVEVEVAPEIKLPELDGIEVKKPIIEVTDEMVQAEMTQLMTNEGELEPREKAEAGDYCVGHGVMKGPKDEVVLDIQGAVIRVPEKGEKTEGMILGVLVEDFAKQVGSPKPGDTVTVKTKGPENHETESIRGKPIVITFKIDEIHRIIPATAEGLVAKFGMESEQQLREAIMLRLNQRAMVEQQSVMRQQIAKKLLDSVKFDLPEKITARQAERNIARQRFELMHRGVDEAKVEEHIAKVRSSSAETASRELKLFFILDRVATERNIGLTEAEVNGRIAQMAMSRGQRPEHLRAELIRTGQVTGVAQQIREHKALDSILAKAKVNEVPLEEYNKGVREGGEG